MDYPEIKDDELLNSLDEYKSKLEEIIQKKNEKLRVIAEQQAQETSYLHPKYRLQWRVVVQK